MPNEMIVPAILAVLGTVIVSTAVARILRSIVPVPLVQVALGLLLAQVTDLRLRVDPDMFLLLFLPPLLFLDAWRIPKDVVRRDGRIMIELAFGLVIATVAGIGIFIHWLIPTMPTAMAFAVAAVLSPTDAVAVSAIARRSPMPPRLKHVLEGEALLNDASALVCLRFAVAALLTDTFSVWSGILAFLWVALAGLALGAVLAWVVGVAAARIAQVFDEDAGSHILLTILLPFAAYLLAEAVEASGILAAVAAGLVTSRVERLAKRSAATRLRREASWDTIALALNGAVFVLLGEQLSLIVRLGGRSATLSGAGSVGGLILYALTIMLLLLAIRAVWVWISMWLDVRRQPDLHPFRQPPWPLVAAGTLAGVRGTVTLVAVLTIPRMLPDGTPLPASAVAVTMATGVILMSLVLASIALPPLLKRLDGLGNEPEKEVQAARRTVAAHVLPRIQRLCDAHAGPQATALAAEYRAIAERETDQASRNVEAIALRLACIAAERHTVFELLEARRLNDEAASQLLRELDAAELHHAGRSNL